VTLAGAAGRYEADPIRRKEGHYRCSTENTLTPRLYPCVT
jgi:hypothetical protein